MLDPGGVPGLSFQGFGDGEAQVWSIFTQWEGCGGLGDWLMDGGLFWDIGFCILNRTVLQGEQR